MARESMHKPGTAKVNSTPQVTLESAAVWVQHTEKHTKGPDSRVPPPVWTRYIDSRLKQFCTR
jgi:hypothetical protein